MADQWVYPPLSWVLKEEREKKEKKRKKGVSLDSLLLVCTIKPNVSRVASKAIDHQPELFQISFQFQLSIGSLRSLPTGD